MSSRLSNAPQETTGISLADSARLYAGSDRLSFEGAAARLGEAAGVAVALLGPIVLAGWALELPNLKSVLPGLATMKANTALCFVLAGTGLALVRWTGPTASWVVRVCAVAVSALAFLTLIQDLGNSDFGIDELLFRDRDTPESRHPGRMATATATAFLAAGTALLMLPRRTSTRTVLNALRALSLSVAFIGGIGVIGYALDFEILYSWGAYSTVALPTAAGFLVLGAGLWAAASRFAPAPTQEARITALALGLLLVAATTIGIFAFAAAEIDVRNALAAGFKTSLSARVTQIRSTIELRSVRAATITTRPNMLKYIRLAAEEPRKAEYREVVQGVLESYAPHGFHSLAVSLPNGIEIAQMGAPIENPAMVQALRAPTDVQLLWRNGLYLRNRFVLEDPKGALGTLVSDQFLPETTRDLLEGAAEGRTAETLLCALEPATVKCFPSKLNPQPSRLPLDALGLGPLVQRATKGETGFATVVDQRGQRVIAGFAPVGTGGLVALFKMDTAEAFAPLGDQIRFAVLLLAAVCAAGYALVRLRLRPLASVLEQQVRERTVELRRKVAELEQAHAALAKHAERLRILHEIDRGLVANEAPVAIAGAVIQPLRDLLGVPRAIVNIFDVAAGEVEWLAAAGRRRTHVGPGVRYSIRMMGDVEALKRGEPQVIDTRSLPAGPEVDALLASGVNAYMVVPMIAGGELIGALSFGGEEKAFPADQAGIAREVATQLAIAITQARLLERVKGHAAELEQRVAERTGELAEANRVLRESEEELRMLHAATLEISRASGSTEALAILLRMLCEYAGWSFAQSWLPHAGTTRLKLGPAWYSRVGGLDAFRQANERLAFAPEDGALERVGKTGQPDWVWDLQPAPKAVRRPLMIEAGLKSWIGFPVLADGEVIAVIEFFDTELRSRDERMLRLISILATQLGPVIQRKRAVEQIDALNANLQRYTVELEATNKELEAFSYSVSHDLRAPLRAVDGYARMLEEDYRERLDAEGQRLLQVVREASSRMGRLIDDLLGFSKLGRQEPAMRRIDMNALVAEVIAELRGEASAAIETAALPAAEADPAMTKQVWANLVGNALKYSGKRDAARIEIGAREEPHERIYWVRDNGVGFDMRYAEKLFGVFQRLHRADEFPGTGVGLAIVQRVITRHGGRVWAESRPGEGACFYFSLPRETR